MVNNSSTKVVEGALSKSIKEVANVENISYSDYKNNIQGNSLVKIQIMDEKDKVIDEVTCNDMSNKKLSTDDALKAKIDLTKKYTVGKNTQYSLKGGETDVSIKENVALASSQIIIRTEDLMARYPDINAIDIKYISKKADDQKSSPYNTIDIYVRAFNDSGTVVDMIITYIPAIPAPDTET